MTELTRVDPENPDKKVINKAVQIIKDGGVVVFPTETVYGIGVNALDENAVKKLFKIKGRTENKPLQILLSDKKDIKNYVKEISPSAQKLIDKYCPGPITLIFNKSDKISDIVTAGSDTIGIRIPDHLVIRELIKKAEVPIAASSANRSGEPAPIKAEGIDKSLDEVDLILDGGKVTLGVASTVVDVTKEPFQVLREGSIKL